MRPGPEHLRSLKTFNEILDIVEKNYVEPVETKTLLQGAVNGMMRSLDPHSSYMTADMYRELEVETKGRFGGIGIEITIRKERPHRRLADRGHAGLPGRRQGR